MESWKELSILQMHKAKLRKHVEADGTPFNLVSLKAQGVYFESCDKHVHFDRWEVIHTEVSQKYDTAMINQLATQSGLEIIEIFYDCKHYFCDVMMRKQ